MKQRFHLLIVLCPLFAACSGGHLDLSVDMPGPGGVTDNADGSQTWRDGIKVEAADGSSVCERLRIYVYTPARAPSDTSRPPDAMQPAYSGRGIGVYNPETRQCAALITQMQPREDYWVLVDYPVQSPDDPKVSYYFTAKPTPFPVKVRAGVYPVRIADKETTTLTVSLAKDVAEVPAP